VRGWTMPTKQWIRTNKHGRNRMNSAFTSCRCRVAPGGGTGPTVRVLFCCRPRALTRRLFRSDRLLRDAPPDETDRKFRKATREVRDDRELFDTPTNRETAGNGARVCDVCDPHHFRMRCCGGNIQPSLCWRTCCDSQSRAPFENPNGIPSRSPGLRGTSYPGSSSDKHPQPQGG